MDAPQASKSPGQHWAVCPRFTEGAMVPEWFHREDDAREWQNVIVIPATIFGDEEILPPDPESGSDDRRIVRPIVPIRCCSHWDAGGNEWIVIERTDGKPISNGVCAFPRGTNGLSSISPNELPQGYVQETRRHEQGWCDLVPINWIDEQLGDPYRGPCFRDFLPMDTVSSVQATDLDADIEEISESRHPNVACDLGDDWQFDHLQADANKREGHLFRGRVIESLSHQLVRIAYDLEGHLLELHPNLPAQSIAAFWTSWPVWRHFAAWCPKILREMCQQSRSASLLHGAGETMAIGFACRQMWAYAQEVKTWKSRSNSSIGQSRINRNGDFENQSCAQPSDPLAISTQLATALPNTVVERRPAQPTPEQTTVGEKLDTEHIGGLGQLAPATAANGDSKTGEQAARLEKEPVLPSLADDGGASRALPQEEAHAEKSQRQGVDTANGSGLNAEDLERGRIRTAWLDARLVSKEWTSDLDIHNNSGPTYDTIQRYRSGLKSTRDRYVRQLLSKAFVCNVSEVPE